MLYMFNTATKFNGDVSNWDVSSVTTMKEMFYGATEFNGDVSNWDVSSVTYMAVGYQSSQYLLQYQTQYYYIYLIDV